MAMKKEPNVVIDCSDSESDNKKGQKIKPRLKKDYMKQQNKQPELSRQFSDFNERSQEEIPLPKQKKIDVADPNLAGLINNQLLYQSHNQMMPNFQDDVIANQDYFGGSNSNFNKLEKSVEQLSEPIGHRTKYSELD